MKQKTKSDSGIVPAIALLAIIFGSGGGWLAMRVPPLVPKEQVVKQMREQEKSLENSGPIKLGPNKSNDNSVTEESKSI